MKTATTESPQYLTRADAESFEGVSRLIAQEMDAAWVRIIQGLVDSANGDKKAVEELGMKVDAAELQTFVRYLNGAHLGIGFDCRLPKGRGSTYGSHDVSLPPTLKMNGNQETLGGSISIGVSVDF